MAYSNRTEFPASDFPIMQEWMVALLRHTGTIDEAWQSTSATAHISADRADRLVKPARGLSGRERVDIYREMYYLRLIDALAVDVPLVRYCLGEEQFEAIAMRYFVEHPSRSYTLNRVSDQFPTFLLALTHRTLPEALHDTTQDDMALLADIAHVELTAVWAFDAPTAESISTATLQAIPPEQYGNLRLKAHPAVFLHESKYPILAIIDTLTARMEREQEQNDHTSITLTNHDRDSLFASLCHEAPSYVLTYRPEFVAEYHAFDVEQFVLLRALLAGATLEQAIGTLIEQPAVAHLLSEQPTHVNHLMQSVMTWFSEWVALGIFVAVEW